MQYLKFSFLVILVFLLNACSQRQTYQAIQNGQKQSCELETDEDVRNECNAGLGMPFDDYQGERRELVNDAISQLSELMQHTFATAPSDPENHFRDKRVLLNSSTETGVWLYYQLNTGPEGKLYRQRIIQLLPNGRNSIIQKTYTLKDPAAWENAWGNEEQLTSFSRQDIKPSFSEGCDQVWSRRNGPGEPPIWRGYVDPKTCRYYSERRKAYIFIEGEAVLSNRMLQQTERGFDQDGKQLFGTEPGEFIQLYRR